MTKRIFRSIFLVACVTLLACIVIVIGVLYDYFNSMQMSALNDRLILASHSVEQLGVDYFKDLENGDYRMTWVDSDGTVLYDSRKDAASMENHAEREEIREALESASGESQRRSDTFAERTLYRAMRLADGTVLRISVTQNTVFTLLMGMIQPIAVIIGIAVALSVWLAFRISKRIVGPLNELDLDNPLENEAYEEIAPLLRRIEQQRRQITRQMETLQQRKNEFETITGNMSEGLVLLNSAGEILSINKAAKDIFHTDEFCAGQHMLSVERNVHMQQLVNDALSGVRGEAEVTIWGTEYQVDANPVYTEDAVSGACLLVFDLTAKAQAERQRREFSANVSHELKTPLHSIMGSAELMENGLVKSEDMPRFAHLIRTESARLVTLINDIIRLSQLDGGGDLPRENIELSALVAQSAESLAPTAAEKQVTIETDCAPVAISGVRALLFETIYNLCENAVKYNITGGKVCVSVKEDGDFAVLTVSDTGIGIPPEDHDRVFERFYRVDKSHSRATGGTGLGLSIVKHAVALHGGSIELQSTPGEGTAVTVKLPRR